MLGTLIVTGHCFADTKYKYTYVTPKAPVITDSLKPCIVKYKEGNYTGAIADLKELTKKEPHNDYAKYYLGLSYLQLGYIEEATAAFNQVVKGGTNESLSFYSQRAIMCMSNPSQEVCNPSFAPTTKASVLTKEEPVADDDITQFIYSGKKIHPAAMDLIINERMEVKLQQDEYKRKQQEQIGPLSAVPSNEEIASALNTLAKIGIDPFGQNYLLSGNGVEYNYLNNYGSMPYSYKNSNSDIGQMLLYSQLNQHKNNFINYGI